jgi:hypothetical protein
MLTDTAIYAIPITTGPGDVIENLDLDAMVELVLGLVQFLEQ